MCSPACFCFKYSWCVEDENMTRNQEIDFYIELSLVCSAGVLLALQLCDRHLDCYVRR